jgi:hypothetical protein
MDSTYILQGTIADCISFPRFAGWTDWELLRSGKSDQYE